MFQVICNALWYLTNQHMVIADAALHHDITTVPCIFSTLQGFNEIKRKKIKEQPMSQDQLNKHAECLVSVLDRAIISTNPTFLEAIQELIKTFTSYSQYLESKRLYTESNHSRPVPRTVGENLTLETKDKTATVLERYKKIDTALSQMKPYEPILFDEDTHLSSPFPNPQMRWNFIDALRTSERIQIMKYTPGGSRLSIIYMWRVGEEVDENSVAKIISDIQGTLPVIHSRAQRKAFLDRYVKDAYG